MNTPTKSPEVPSFDSLMKQINDYVSHRVAAETMPGYVSQDSFERVLFAAESAESELQDALRTALLASAAGGQDDSNRSLWALEKAREIANQICAESSPPTFRAKLIDLVMGALYTAPPPPVGAPQGVTEKEVTAFRCAMSWRANELPDDQIRHALESFAASRPTAPQAAVDAEFEKLEAVIACLGDDAASLRDHPATEEIADNMDRAAELLEWLAVVAASLKRIAKRERHRGTVFLDIEDLLEVDFTLAGAPATGEGAQS